MTKEHPAFTRAKALSEPLRSHFPKSSDEAVVWQPMVRMRALAGRVLVVARTRVVCEWSAYADVVPGLNHRNEIEAVLNYGSKLPQNVARTLFPEFDAVPYDD